MAGHNKWSKIKHKKAVKDPRKSKIFSQLSRQIQVAVRKGGADPKTNPQLRSIIEEAKAANLPKENIQRAIDKGLGKDKTGPQENITLEGYGPAGVAFLIHAATNNRNRTVQEIRNLFDHQGGSLGKPGSAAYIFNNDPLHPSFKHPVTNPTEKSKLQDLIKALEEHEDVTEFYHNASL